MSPSAVLLLVVIGGVYTLLMLLNEFFILPALRSHFASDGARGARRRQRKFEWACRQAVSYFYAVGSLQSVRNLPLSLAADFGLLVTGAQVGLFLLGILFVGIAWYRWEHAWQN
jgi:hypothetical protein